jgi:excisionase family DNA binding protein
MNQIIINPKFKRRYMEETEHNISVDRGIHDAIMTPKQVARYLQISPRTVYSRWEKLGGVKFGRTLRFRKEIIDALFRPEEKKVERGGEKRQGKVHASVPYENGSEELGSQEDGRTGKSGSGENRNRHGLVDDE